MVFLGQHLGLKVNLIHLVLHMAATVYLLDLVQLIANLVFGVGEVIKILFLLFLLTYK